MVKLGKAKTVCICEMSPVANQFWLPRTCQEFPTRLSPRDIDGGTFSSCLKGENFILVRSYGEIAM